MGFEYVSVTRVTECHKISRFLNPCLFFSFLVNLYMSDQRTERIVNGYRLQNVIGRGSSGKVMLGCHEVTGDLVSKAGWMREFGSD